MFAVEARLVLYAHAMSPVQQDEHNILRKALAY